MHLITSLSLRNRSSKRQKFIWIHTFTLNLLKLSNGQKSHHRVTKRSLVASPLLTPNLFLVKCRSSVHECHYHGTQGEGLQWHMKFRGGAQPWSPFSLSRFSSRPLHQSNVWDQAFKEAFWAKWSGHDWGRIYYFCCNLNKINKTQQLVYECKCAAVFLQNAYCKHWRISRNHR